MAIDLNIEGRHALLFDDDASAAFVNSRAALVPWTGDESLLIDRYDVRHLLDRIPPRSKKLRFVEDTGGVSQSELDRERFLDLPLNNEDEDNEDEETTERSEATGSGSYQAVPFSYGNNGGSADPNSYGQDHSSYHPPFSVPTSLISNLPPTEKLHQIMARTALFVSEHGGQSEIVLRVKQGNNPTFGFLMPDNQLHPYFRFLVDHPHLLKTDNTQEDKKLEDQESEALSAAGGALSLLGSLYGTGEDDDNTHQQKPEEGEATKPNAGGDSLSPHKSVREEYAPSASIEDKETIKRAISVPTKERGLLLPKKNHFLNSGSITKKVEGVTSQHGVTNRRNSQPSKTDAKPLILEPPSFLKKAIDKIVEFILKNGKEFEAVLIEQDKTAGRFPFLLPANPFNPYYLKVLEEAKESKSPSKKPSDKRKRRSQEPSLSESTADEELEDRYLDPQRKDKFKMTIGSKKESNDQPTEPIKRSGVTTDEAAAIVLAATRGRSPAFQNSSAADSESAQTSNIHKQISKPPVSIANAIAKTAAIATAGEADSSEATLTKEQKLKAERLKRAKMFAAMIKSGVNPTSQSVHSTGIQNESVENHEEREGSSVPFDAEFSGKDRNYRKRHHSRSRDEEEEAEEDEDSDEDHKHARKKHHKHHHRHHKHRHHHHRRHKHHSDSESEKKRERSSRHRHRRRKHESSEDEERERSHKHRRKHSSPSEIEEGEIEVETKEAVDSHVEETDAKVSEITEVPSDLRAKIRAMLLETI